MLPAFSDFSVVSISIGISVVSAAGAVSSVIAASAAITEPLL